jgi:hypothetical protein
MSQQKQGFNPSNQKLNPRGKYNEKKWVKLSRRDILDIDQVDRVLYNDISMSEVYKSTDNMYIRKPDAKRPGKKTNNEQKQ